MKHDYRRAPLPESTQTPILAISALWMGFIFSPFVSFYVNGRVDDSNWTPAIVTALGCFAGLLLIHARTTSRYNKVPGDIRAEYVHGRLMPPLQDSGAGARPIEFGPRGPDRSLAGVTLTGIWFAPDAIRGASWGQNRRMLDTNIKAGLAGGSKLPAHAFEWSELVEWQVRDNSDGPDFYRLVLHDGGHVDLMRPNNSSEEPAILDYVRAVGGRPVRLLCDIA
jgi:hypothetical protein